MRWIIVKQTANQATFNPVWVGYEKQAHSKSASHFREWTNSELQV